jgi:type IV secretory pathway protease TraF
LNRLTIGTKYILNKNEYFLLGEGSNSYDSRYFGVVKNDDLRYKAILLWQRERTIF